MRRALVLLLAAAIIVAACGGTDSADTTSAAAPATTVPETTAPSTDDTPPEPWPADNAEKLIALEEANAGQWTVDTALEAVQLVREVLLAGTEAYPPIDTTGLTRYLARNFDEVSPQEWDTVLASGVNARPAAFYQTEEQRLVYQRIAEQANKDFEAVSRHTLGIPIFVALSDFEMPGHLFAGTLVKEDNIEAFAGWFNDESRFNDTADAFEELLEDSDQVCVMVLGGTMRRWSADRQVAGILHEIVHCHQQTIYPGGLLAYSSSRSKWMDEGYAGYAGEALSGGTLNSLPWWNGYFEGGLGSSDDGFQLFRSEYEAMPFFSMIAAGGVDPYAQFIPWFTELRLAGVSDSARVTGMIAGVAPEIVAGWAASASRNDSLGAPWDSASGPGVNNASELREPRRSSGGAFGTDYSARAGEQRYWVIDFPTDFDEPSLITLEAQGFGTFHWDHESWDEQYVVTDSLDIAWCVGEDCVCEDGTSPAPGALPAPIASGETPVMHAAIFGAATGADFAVTLETLEDACEEEEEPVDAGPLDACLFGTWIPDPEQFEDLLLTQYRSLGLTGATLTGTLALTFNSDGTFTQDYVDVTASGTILGETGTAALFGGSFGSWSAAGGVITLNIEGGSVDVVLNGEGLGGQPVPGGTTALGGYDCGPTTLEIDPPEIAGGLLPFPTDWSKTP